MTETETCFSCQEAFESEDVVFLECSNTFCEPCFVRFLRAEAVKVDGEKFCCPDGDCGVKIPVELVACFRKELGADFDIGCYWSEQTSCPYCGLQCYQDQAENLALCHFCDWVFCTDCRKDFHGRNADSFSSSKSEAEKEIDSSFLIQHSSGYNEYLTVYNDIQLDCSLCLNFLKPCQEVSQHLPKHYSYFKCQCKYHWRIPKRDLKVWAAEVEGQRRLGIYWIPLVDRWAYFTRGWPERKKLNSKMKKEAATATLPDLSEAGHELLKDPLIKTFSNLKV